MMSIRNVSVTRAEMARAKAQVAQAKAALDRAEEDLRNSTIVRPDGWLVLSRNVEVGDAVSSILVLGSQATLIMTLGDIGDVYVLGKWTRPTSARSTWGSVRALSSSRSRTRSSKARSPRSRRSASRRTTSRRLRCAFRSAIQAANSRQHERQRRDHPGRKHKVLTIPENAVIYDRERKTFVEVPDPTQEKGRRRQAIQTGISTGVKTELASGLKQGDKIILQ